MADEAVAFFKVKADTSTAVKEIEKLRTAQKGVGYEVEKTASAFDKFVNSASDSMAKFNLAMGGVEKALGYVKKTLDISKEVDAMERFERALPSGAVDRLARASQGMIDKATQLRLGVKGLTGDFALTQTQMEKVMQTAVALEQRGFGPAAENAEKLIDALAKGVNKLDDFGINLEKTRDRQHDVNAAMEKFDEIVAATGPLDERTESLAKMQRTIEDATLAIKQMIAAAVTGIASVVNAMRQGARDYAGDKTATGVFGKLGAFLYAPVEGVSQAWGGEYGWGGGDAMKLFTGSGNAAQPFIKGLGFRPTAPPVTSFPGRAGSPYAPQTIDMTGDGMVIGRSQPPDPYRSNAYQARDREINLGGALGYLQDAGGPLSIGRQLGYGSTSQGALRMLGPGQGMSLSGAFGGGGLFGANRFQFDQDPMAKLRDKNPLANLEQQLGDTSTAVGTAYATISSGITAAVDAAITGSDSIGKAAAKASAMVLKSLSIEATGRAVFYGAMALGSLAYGNAADAAKFGATAAKFALAAAATGAGAALLGSSVGAFGGGGGAAQQPAGGGFSRSPTAGQNMAGGTNITINFGDGFVGDQRQVADLVAKAVKDSQRRGGTRDSSVRFDG